jgi:hypothetical protein
MKLDPLEVSYYKQRMHHVLRQFYGYHHKFSRDWFCYSQMTLIGQVETVSLTYPQHFGEINHVFIISNNGK